MGKNKKPASAAPAAAGASLGGPPATSLGGPPATSLGGPPATSLGGPPAGSATTSLGGPPAAATSLGGPPAGSSLGGAPAAAPTSSAAAKKKKKKAAAAAAATSLGGPPATSLGGPPAATSLGGPPATATSIGGPPAATSIGGPPAGTALGGATVTPAAVGASLGGMSLGGSTGEAATEKKDKKKKTKKKKAAAAAPAEPEAKKPKMSKLAMKIKKKQEEEERLRLEEEAFEREEEERLARLAEENEKKKTEKVERKKQDKEKNKEALKLRQQREQIAKLKAAGFVLPPALKKLDDQLNGIESDDSELSDPKEMARQAEQRRKKAEAARKKREEEAAAAAAEEDGEDSAGEDWDAMYDSDGEDDPEAAAKAAAAAREEAEAKALAEEAARKAEAEKHAATTIQEGEMRSPICCVLGHVDTGKTLLLDKIRRSNVQRGEAGGITQQIGATYLPMDGIKRLTATLNETMNLEYKVPGLLVIDTPGHESFTNLRSRGSSLCDIAVLVVDINHGIEQQTEESLKLLQKRKTPFIVALNKIDRIYEWAPQKDAPIRTSLAKQPKHVLKQFNDMLESMQVLFAERGFNAVPYYKNKDFRKNLSIVPTSAVTGEGIPDLLMLLVQLTQRMMSDKLYLSPTLKCTVLEIKVTEGLGTTADVIISDGIIHEGDRIVLCGMHGPIVTSIRALLTPPHMKEIRVKAGGKGNPYVPHKVIKAAMGIKIVAHDLQDCVAGSALLVVGEGDDVEELKEEVQMDLRKLQKSVATTARGVFVQASTLGSLEALLSHLKDNKIPVSAIGIGPIHKRDVMRASVMLEHDKKFAAILAFDVKIEKEAAKLAEKLGVRIFDAPIIYHLSDQFSAHLQAIEDERRRVHAGEAVWPVVLEIMPEHIFNKKDPLIFGATVVEGTLRINTPLCAIKDTENLYLGKVTSIEDNRVAVQEAGPGTKVAIKISPEDYAYAYERHFTHEHPLMSRITRHSLDRLKEFFAKQLTKRDIRLLKDMKQIYGVDD